MSKIIFHNDYAAQEPNKTNSMNIPNTISPILMDSSFIPPKSAKHHIKIIRKNPNIIIPDSNI